MLVLAFLAAALFPADSLVFRGDARELEVSAPRIESVDVRIDGRLDEPEWGEAAVLTGFTQYEPIEAIPASQRTEVLVFYSSDAIYFGIRAFDTQPEQIRATLAERGPLRVL